MVNITKRMHKLMPLWNVKSGAGACILPPKPPAPQLASLTLRLPNPCNAHDEGARQIWKKYLPGLRYHNLTLPINVEQSLKPGPSFIPTMTLEFESQNRETLDNLDVRPTQSDAEALQAAITERAVKQQQDRVREVEEQRRPQRSNANASANEDTWVEVLRKEQENVGSPSGSGTKLGEVKTKAQPAADPSAPSTTSPPATIYTREVTLGLRARNATQIWGWFEKVTQARHFARSKDDTREIRRYGRFFKKAQKDRVRVKAGIDAMRREKEDLKRAREAADRLASEA